MELAKKYTFEELRPSAVILAAKFIKAGCDSYEAACKVQQYLLNNGVQLNKFGVRMHLIIIEAQQNPLFDNKIKVTDRI